MSIITIFFLLLIVIAMVRVLSAPLQTSESCQNSLSVDILVTDSIPMDTKTISKNQNTTLVCGMSVLIAQNTEEDGLYLLDTSHELIRVDCLKSDITYMIQGGKNQGQSFKPSYSSRQTHILKHVFTANGALELSSDTAEVILFLQQEVMDVSLKFTDCNLMLIISNACQHDVVIKGNYLGKTELQQNEFLLSPGTHHLLVVDNQLQRM